MNYRLLCMSVIALLCAGCGQKTPIGDVPQEFYFSGAPIDPSCFVDSTAQVGNDSISLTVCTGKNKATPEYKDNHFYGVEIDDSNGGVSQSYVYYRYLGEIDGKHVIQTLSSSGGTSQYTSVRLVSLEGNLLRSIKRFASGDRCNGGVTDASVSGGTVIYSKNITPFDLATLTNGMDAGFRRDVDLAGDAASCVGTANYEDDELKSITLTMDPKDFPAEETAKGTCFLDLYKETYKPNTTLDSDKVVYFGQDLNTRCGALGKPN